MATLFALLAGASLGIGLIISGMANPAKVLGFLDVSGAWDPSLAFVMGGAVLVGAFAFTFARKRTVSLLGLQMRMPAATGPAQRLVAGSLLFGIGWGIAGFCPGPALVALGMGEQKAMVFVAAMLVGMGLFEQLERRDADRTAAA